MSERFLAGSLGFCDSPWWYRVVLDQQDFNPSPSLAQWP